MDNNSNSFKTLMYIALGLIIVILAVVFLTKNKKNAGDENNVIGTAKVESIDIVQLESFPVQVNVIAKGYLPDSCTTLGEVKQSYNANKFTITLESKRPLDAEMCAQVIENFEKTISLNGVVGLAKGTYSVDVNGVMGAFTLSMDNYISETDPLK